MSSLFYQEKGKLVNEGTICNSIDQKRCCSYKTFKTSFNVWAKSQEKVVVILKSVKTMF